MPQRLHLVAAVSPLTDIELTMSENTRHISTKQRSPERRAHLNHATVNYLLVRCTIRYVRLDHSQQVLAALKRLRRGRLGWLSTCRNFTACEPHRCRTRRQVRGGNDPEGRHRLALYSNSRVGIVLSALLSPHRLTPTRKS